MNKIEQLQAIFDDSSRIVFFTGAGVSTESGIPDFRSVDGLYNMKYKYPPEEIISNSFFWANPEEFYRFYRDKMIIPGVKPNPAHLKMGNLKRPARLWELLPRTLTVCIPQPAVSMSANCTARPIRITALSAASTTAWKTFWTWTMCQDALAAA